MRKTYPILFVLIFIMEAAVAAKPTAPEGLVAEPLSGTSVKLTWTDQADNEDRYELSRSDDGETWNVIAGD